MTTTPKNEQLAAQTHLIRAVEAALKIDSPETIEIRFRSTLLKRAMAEAPKLKTAFLIRLHEAAAEVKYPRTSIRTYTRAAIALAAAAIILSCIGCTPVADTHPVTGRDQGIDARTIAWTGLGLLGLLLAWASYHLGLHEGRHAGREEGWEQGWHSARQTILRKLQRHAYHPHLPPPSLTNHQSKIKNQKSSI